MSDMELISVIIPSYNRERTIERAINSVLEQSYSKYEIIIIDDASTDNTVEIIKRIKRNEIILLVNDTNKGACYSRNAGIEAARGKYIAFLDSDDEWEKTFLAEQVDILKEGKYDMTCCGFVRIRNGKKKQIIKQNIEENVFNELLSDNFITTGTILIKSEIIKKEKFNTDMPRYQDWELALRLSKKYNVNYTKKALLIQYHQSDSITYCALGIKTIYALNVIIKENIKELERRPVKLAQLYWWMGMASIEANNLDIQAFYKAIKYKMKLKYVFTYLFLRIGGYRIVKYIHSKRVKKWRQ